MCIWHIVIITRYEALGFDTFQNTAVHLHLKRNK